MRTVRRLLWRDILASVGFVSLAFLSLFFFIDFVDELGKVGERGRTVGHAALAALYELPGLFYELMPIAVLIGTIYTLARLAQSSEFTILRTGGLGPGRALTLLATLGLAFAALTFAIGDWLAPAGERAGVRLQARFDERLPISTAPGAAPGAWLKERRSGTEGEGSVSVHVAAASASGQLQAVRIFVFDSDGALVERLGARAASVGDDGHWTLRDVERVRWPVGQRAPELDPLGPGPLATHERLAQLRWPSTLDADVVAAAVLPLATMTTLELWRYAAHLSDQEQATQRHQIRFWGKALYPFACLVMVALALPFAYLHARAGGISLKVFGGIMLGISFVLLNKLSGHIGTLNGWTPWLAAAAPSLLYLLLSMAAFAWLVRYR
jgi:lipopolysaccharide export system permease protein